MKKLYLIQILVLLIISNNAFSQFRLDIEISGIRNSSGKIMLQLFDENEKVIKQEINPIKDKTCSVSIRDLNPGFYAIRYYHDENQNGKMETNLVGKPTEGYGFSNNVTGKFGAPPFEKWLFELKENKKIRLDISY
jgi:uncharacterized protein (DUF2141 family)